MKTKIPTLEEVKEYFKNAKEVKCLFDKKLYSTNAMIEDFYYDKYTGWWFDVLLFEGTIENVLVWDVCKNKFAEIISYKEETTEKIGHLETTKKDSIVESIVNQFKERSKRGIEKYGTTLQENNTDDFLQHFKEELMDAILYIEKLQTQRNEK